MHKIAIAAVILLATLSPRAHAQAEWKRVGPESQGQIIYSIGVHPRNPAILLIGCRPLPHNEAEMAVPGPDGFDLTTDAGATWAQVGKNVPNTTNAGPNENSARFNPGFPDEAWMGVEKHGAYHSADGGKTWEHLAAGLKTDSNKYALNGICFGFDPRTPKTVYYGSDGGVYKSIDTGRHWAALQNGLPGKSGTATVTSIVVDTAHPDTVYASFAIVTDMPAGVYKSTDAGEHWAFAGKGLPERSISGDHLGVTDLVPDPHNSATLFAVLEVDLLNDPHDRGGIYKSTDGGATWNALALTSTPATTIAISPRNWLVYLGTRINNQQLYAGSTDGAVYRSDDGGATWKDCSAGLKVGIKEFPYTFTFEGSDGTLHELTSYCYESRIRELAFTCKAPWLLYAGATDGLYVLKP